MIYAKKIWKIKIVEIFLDLFNPIFRVIAYHIIYTIGILIDRQFQAELKYFYKSNAYSAVENIITSMRNQKNSAQNTQNFKRTRKQYLWGKFF